MKIVPVHRDGGGGDSLVSMNGNEFTCSDIYTPVVLTASIDEIKLAAIEAVKTHLKPH
jgi:hypothetical protein